MFTPEAVAALDACLRAQQPPIDEFRHLAMAFASFHSEAERLDRIARLEALAALPAFAREDYQITVQEIVAKDLNDLKGEYLDASYPLPREFGTPTKVSGAATIAALPGDAARGKAAATRCLICHRIGGEGVAFGPDLTAWGAQRTIEEIAKEIIDPDAKLAHGYDKPVRLKKGEFVAEGLMTNYSWHAGSLKIKLMGGLTKKIEFRRGGIGVEELKESPMPTAGEMAMTDQDVRDVAEFLKTFDHAALAAAPAGEKLPPDGTTEGWEILTGEDFVNVNCHDDTWRWVGGHAFCTGRPTGVIRYREPLVNFELICEWMHKQKGGNSGVFVWATPQSIANLSAGRGALPHGIEVQVLDLGYAEVYTKQYNKPADWFTSHGDVFPVGPVKMRPFPPVAPDNMQLPSRKRPRGPTSGTTTTSAPSTAKSASGSMARRSPAAASRPPAASFCLESEGAPVEFRNLRLRSSRRPTSRRLRSTRSCRRRSSRSTSKATPRWAHSITASIPASRPHRLRRCAKAKVVWKRRCISKSEDGFVLEEATSGTRSKTASSTSRGATRRGGRSRMPSDKNCWGRSVSLRSDPTPWLRYSSDQHPPPLAPSRFSRGRLRRRRQLRRSFLTKRDVRPIFKAACFHCHGESGVAKGELDLRLVRLMQAGGESGAAVLPGDAAGSLLWKRDRCP
ncbi:MAG: c-type cytochrome [Verrucomicrobiales bacterium]